MQRFLLNPLIIGLFLFFAIPCCYAQVAKSDSIINPEPEKKYTLDEYVQRYKEIAITEMERSGIPASITLAQGIHESGCGNSRLAKEANNHFGIKCHKGWDGKTYYQWDDDPEESCFRVYENATLSYVDHSDFLKTRSHYDFLFEYDKTDYTKWAKGLKKAGYATDPKYPDKLIGTIEKHKLNLYDLTMAPVLISSIDTSHQPIFTTDQNNVYVKKPEVSARKLRIKPRSFLFSAYKKGFFSQNGSSYAHARKNETALEFATRFDIPYRKFLLFNDLVDGDRLIDYQYCYIQPKKSRFKGEIAYHRVKDDVTMYEIAQYYGIRLDLLLERNMMSEGQEPANGELVMLNEKVSVTPALRSPKAVDLLPTDSSSWNSNNSSVLPEYRVERIDTIRKDPAPKPVLKINQPVYPDSVYHLNKTELIETEDKGLDWIEAMEAEIRRKEADAKNDDILEFPDTLEKNDEILSDIPNNVPLPKDDTENSDYSLHKVLSKETLFGLQRQYGVSWQRIKAYNNLTSDSLKENQVLKIPKK